MKIRLKHCLTNNEHNRILLEQLWVIKGCCFAHSLQMYVCVCVFVRDKNCRLYAKSKTIQTNKIETFSIHFDRYYFSITTIACCRRQNWNRPQNDIVAIFFSLSRLIQNERMLISILFRGKKKKRHEKITHIFNKCNHSCCFFLLKSFLSCERHWNFAYVSKHQPFIAVLVVWKSTSINKN